VSDRLADASPRWRWAPALLFACAGAALLVYFERAGRPLWLDEEMIALNLRDRGLLQLAGPLWLNQAAPLGWMALVRMLLVMFGTSERVLRAVPMLFGLATLATAYWFARRWLGPIGAAVLTLLVAFGDHLWYFALELKHYSADAFGGLLVPALAIWAIDAPAEDALRRVNRWWLAAALAQWFSYGALFATPASAVIVMATIWRRRGWRDVGRSLFPVAVWAASVACNYVLAIRYATGSAYLRGYWTSAFPPPAAGFTATLEWLARQLGPLAANPGGASGAAMFWLIAGAGLALTAAARPALALTFASVPATAFTLAALRLAPLQGRVSLWIVPALYVGIALAADAVAGFRRSAAPKTALAFAVIGAVPVLGVCADVVRTGVLDMRSRPPVPQGVDDREAVRWLMAQRRPGDALVAMHLTLPAVWWYGPVSLSASGGTPESPSGSRLPDDGPLFEVRPSTEPGDCENDGLRTALKERRGAAAYLGFDTIDGFEDLLLNRLSELGRVTTYKKVVTGHAAVVDLTQPAAGSFLVPGHPPTGRPAGCVVVRRAERW
jgi:hypothetical protein